MKAKQEQAVSPHEDPLFSISDSARYLGGISPWTVRSYITRGLLVRSKVGGRTFVRESELRRIIHDGPKTISSDRREW